MPKLPADALGEAIRGVSLDTEASSGCKVLEALARLALIMDMPPHGRMSVGQCLLTKAQELERKFVGADGTITILSDTSGQLMQPIFLAAE